MNKDLYVVQETFSLSADDSKALREWALLHGFTVSGLVRKLVERFLHENS